MFEIRENANKCIILKAFFVTIKAIQLGHVSTLRVPSSGSVINICIQHML